jgi:hypothetical protein
LTFFLTSQSIQAQKYDYTESQIKNTFGELLRDAGKYALQEMRPTASVNRAKIVRVKNDSRDNGGDIKARIEVTWTTAFTGRTRTHLNDVWLKIDGDNVYFTKYKMHSDDHNVEILNRTNVTMKKLVGSFSSGSADDDDF